MTQIVETTAGQLFRVTETGDPKLAHVWHGVQVKKTKGGYVDAAKGYTGLVRKAGSKIVGTVR
jgi:hypothetical protein